MGRILPINTVVQFAHLPFLYLLPFQQMYLVLAAVPSLRRVGSLSTNWNGRQADQNRREPPDNAFAMECVWRAANCSRRSNITLLFPVIEMRPSPRPSITYHRTLTDFIAMQTFPELFIFNHDSGLVQFLHSTLRFLYTSHTLQCAGFAM